MLMIMSRLGDDAQPQPALTHRPSPARNNEAIKLGMRCMAARIDDNQSKLVAGLSIFAVADHLTEDWLPRLEATACEISVASDYRA
jgi:DNA-binding IclR family transcriptional regulator